MPGKFLITVIYRRRVCSQLVLSEMLGINECTIGKAITAFPGEIWRPGCGAIILWGA